MRREVEVSYTLSADAPASGPRRVELEDRIRAAIQKVKLPIGYTLETPRSAERVQFRDGWLRDGLPRHHVVRIHHSAKRV